MSSRLKTLTLFLALVLLVSGCAVQARSARPSYDGHEKADAFIDNMVREHGFRRSELEAVFRDARRRDDILELMRKPAEKRLEWHEYRKIFLTGSRIDGGVNFWKEHADILASAEQEFGVEAQIIVAIIGVETRYGGNVGKHRVIDALSTLAFDYPPRSKFFTGELEQYLLLAREEDIDLLHAKGSYAGAMGYGQFIPSSYRNYAVDFSKDGKRDLWNSPRDIIGSVANYFRRHGWKHGAPVAVRAEVTGDDFRTVLKLGYKPNTVLDAMRHDGIVPVGEFPDGMEAALIEFGQPDGPEYWLGFNNFYTITRYNHSPLYAMAVYQLSEEIRAAYEAAGNE